MKKKKGKRYKVKIVNKKKFIRSTAITALILAILITILVFALTRKKTESNTEETQGEVVNLETENTENEKENKNQANTEEIENIVQEDAKAPNNEEEAQTENTTANNETANTNTIEGEGTTDTEIQTLIQTVMAQNGLNENNFGFYYYNVNQKTEYKFNENKIFKGASTIKVPVSMLYYDMINAGTMTKESKLKYTQDSYEAGAGTTASRYKVGSSVPLGFLIEQAIVNSDNTAVNIMIKNLGYSNCKKKIQKYSDEEMPSDYYKSNVITPEFEFDIITYLYNNSINYAELLEYMKKSSNGEYLKGQLPQYEVAHKYGSYGNNVHDYGIIYGKETYIVGVYTQGVANANNLIASIAKQIVDTKEK